MPTTLTYEASGETWTFYFPTVTCTEVVVPSQFGFARMSTRYAYTVRSVLVAEDAADLLDQKEKATRVLNAVGGTFTWNRDGTDVVVWGTDDDANFGPHPSALVFDKFFGVKAAFIIWQVEVEIAAVDSEVMDLVYSVAHSLDRNKYTVRTLSGMLRLNGAFFTPQDFTSADSYRNTIESYVCKTPPGWHRVQEDYQMSIDGLSLTFHIVDEQRLAVLPPNITDGNATLSISGNPRSGAKRDFRLDGWFEAPTDAPDAPQEAFAALAASLFNFQNANEAFRVKDLSFQRDIFRHRLAFSMTWDAFSPIDWTTIPGPGDNETAKRANWMLSLMTRADDWVGQYRNGLATSRGAYGTTNVRGWCVVVI